MQMGVQHNVEEECIVGLAHELAQQGESAAKLLVVEAVHHRCNCQGGQAMGRAMDTIRVKADQKLAWSEASSGEKAMSMPQPKAEHKPAYWEVN